MNASALPRRFGINPDVISVNPMKLNSGMLSLEDAARMRRLQGETTEVSRNEANRDEKLTLFGFIRKLIGL